MPVLPPAPPAPALRWPVRTLPEHGDLLVRVHVADLVRDRESRADVLLRLKCQDVYTGDRFALLFQDWPSMRRSLVATGLLDRDWQIEQRWDQQDRFEVPLTTRHLTIVARQRNSVRSLEFRPLDPRLATKAQLRGSADELAAAVEIAAETLVPVLKRFDLNATAGDMIAAARTVLLRKGEQ